MKNWLLFTLILFCLGCSTKGSIKAGLPSILTSKDEMWTIPKGVSFKAIQHPAYKELTEFMAEDDLTVMYKGKVLELEKEANARVIKTSRSNKRSGIVLGIIGSLLTIVAGAAAKEGFKRLGGKSGT